MKYTPGLSLVKTEDCTKISVQIVQTFLYSLECGQREKCQYFKPFFSAQTGEILQRCDGVVPLVLVLMKSAAQGIVLYSGCISIKEGMNKAETVVEETSSVDFEELKEELGFSLVLLSASLNFTKETLDFICRDIEAFGPLEVLAQRSN
jgi:hypothetical protein